MILNRVLYFGIATLLTAGCATASVGLTEQDLERIRIEIRKEYAAIDLKECRDRGTWTDPSICDTVSFGFKEIFLELKDGEASGFIKYEPRLMWEDVVVTRWCKVTVYDNGDYVWKCSETD
jgi:hypothetical protein